VDLSVVASPRPKHIMQQSQVAITKQYDQAKIVVLYEIIHRRDLEKYLKRFR